VGGVEDEDRPLREPAARGAGRCGSRGERRVAPVQVEEDEVDVSVVLDDVCLEGLELTHRPRLDPDTPAVERHPSRSGDDDEHFDLVVLVWIGGDARSDPAPAGSGAHLLHRAHLDTEHLVQFLGRKDGRLHRRLPWSVTFSSAVRSPSRCAASAAMAGASR